MRRLGPAALGMLLTFSSPLVEASPADLLGFGPRSQAMGATGTAVGRGFETTFTNPALLSRARERQLALGYQTVSFTAYAQGPSAPGNLSLDGVSGSFIGAVLPLPFAAALKDRIALGLGAFTPTDLIARARLLYPERPQFPLLSDRAQSINLNLGLGVDLGYGFRIGAGVLALAELVGTVVVRTDSSGRVGTLVDDQLIATYAPVAGLSYELDEAGLFAGATYRGELRGEFDVVVQVFDLGELKVPDLNIAGVAQYDPEQVSLELGKRFGSLLLAAGVTYKNWSEFPGWARPTVECPASAPDCQALGVEPVGFNDTFVPRLGAEYSVELGRRARAHARAGYFFETTPVPEQRGNSNYWDNDRHAVTLGYGVEIDEPLKLRLDLFYQHHFLISRTHQKDPGVAAGNAGAPKVKTGGGINNLGLVAEVGF